MYISQTHGDNVDPQYSAQLERIFNDGHVKTDRTGTGTKSLFAQMMRIDLTDFKVPFITTKRLFHRIVTDELLWFISGSTDIGPLKAKNINIWDSWVIPKTAKYHDKDWDTIFAELAAKKNDSLTEVIKLVSAWFGLKSFSEFINVDDKAAPSLKEAASNVLSILMKNKITTRWLVGGSIGSAAYGALWRNWEDTAIINKSELEVYEKRGYTKVVDVDEDRIVVNRMIDQLANAIELLRTNPTSRRIIVSSWNPGKLELAVLPSCHSAYQFYSRPRNFSEVWTHVEKYGNVEQKECAQVYQDTVDQYINEEQGNMHELAFIEEQRKLGTPVNALSIFLWQRSADAPVGEPFNLSQYAILCHMVAQITGHVAETMAWTGVDTHIYTNQLTQVNLQLNRIAFEDTVTRIKLDPNVTEIDQFDSGSIAFEGYDEFHPSIKYNVAV